MRDDGISSIIEGIETLERLSNGHLNHWRYILESANTIWQRCPFQVGDFVRLNKTPEITEEKSWGWMSSKHFLVQGARAQVADRKFYDGHFFFGLAFDDESWLDRDGIKNPVSTKALYTFSENWLVNDNYLQLTCEAL